MENSGEHKRFREECVDELESPEVKRLRDDLLFDMLDEDTAATGDEDLASVMKSLEEEIALPSPRSEPQLGEEAFDVAGQPDLGFLFEASDDELGLPPTDVPSSADESGGTAEPQVEVEAMPLPESDGFGQIWGLDDAIEGYDGFGLVMRPEAGEAAPAAAEDGLVFDGGLFDYADELSGPYDMSDLSWRPESLPAV
ncbi:hypothetical protein Cni_G02156 [Canna indica]|uniref:Uncharacterized protein n=1 Tax=Canna indica TaxID=4628 RepID=A0AAQ3PZQ2_9LILI|nr:hypothetical protein Cni_G02156 [Canna indica]